MKLRHCVHPAVCNDVRKMQLDWASFTLILAVAEPPDEWSGMVRCFRSLPSNPTRNLMTSSSAYAAHGFRMHSNGQEGDGKTEPSGRLRTRFFASLLASRSG